MPLRKAQKRMLYKEGFLPSEIFAFETAIAGDVASGHRVKQEFNFNSRTFRALRNSRRQYIKDLKGQGWTDGDIKQKFVSFYKGKKRDVFAFLKLQYAPVRKLTDFEDAVRRRSRASISKHFGAAYGRRLRPEIRPKYLPKRPMYPARPKLVRRVRRTR